MLQSCAPVMTLHRLPLALSTSSALSGPNRPTCSRKGLHAVNHLVLCTWRPTACGRLPPGGQLASAAAIKGRSRPGSCTDQAACPGNAASLEQAGRSRH